MMQYREVTVKGNIIGESSEPVFTEDGIFLYTKRTILIGPENYDNDNTSPNVENK